MKFYNKCECCGKQIEVFPEEYDCLEDLDEPMVCSEECNEEMEGKKWLTQLLEKDRQERMHQCSREIEREKWS